VPKSYQKYISAHKFSVVLHRNPQDLPGHTGNMTKHKMLTQKRLKNLQGDSNTNRRPEKKRKIKGENRDTATVSA
jgi:hypothetical protein